MEIAGEIAGGIVPIAEGDHADAAGLPVAERL
jgi:hypothetical protein